MRVDRIGDVLKAGGELLLVVAPDELAGRAVLRLRPPAEGLLIRPPSGRPATRNAVAGTDLGTCGSWLWISEPGEAQASQAGRGGDARARAVHRDPRARLDAAEEGFDGRSVNA